MTKAKLIGPLAVKFADNVATALGGSTLFLVQRKERLYRELGLKNSDAARQELGYADMDACMEDALVELDEEWPSNILAGSAEEHELLKAVDRAWTLAREAGYDSDTLRKQFDLDD